MVQSFRHLAQHKSSSATDRPNVLITGRVLPTETTLTRLTEAGEAQTPRASEKNGASRVFVSFHGGSSHPMVLFKKKTHNQSLQREGNDSSH